MKLEIHKSYGGFGEYVIQAPGATLDQMKKLITDLENVENLRSKLESVKSECEALRKVRDVYKAKLPKVSPPQPNTPFEEAMLKNDYILEILSQLRERNRTCDRLRAERNDLAAAIERVRKECERLMSWDKHPDVTDAVICIRSAIGDVGEQTQEGKQK